jgi:hypothetical protein
MGSALDSEEISGLQADVTVLIWDVVLAPMINSMSASIGAGHAMFKMGKMQLNMP